MIRVVLVEDQTNLRTEIVSCLRAESFEACGVASGTELFFELMQKPADIILMDIGLRGESGIEILRQLRSLKGLQALGIIMLTGRFDLDCRIECMTNGADAFLIKPVEIEELTAYIHNLYRRIHADNVTLDVLTWQFHHREWRLSCPSGASLELSHLESEFLKILIEHAGTPVTRRDIISAAFKQDPMTYDNRRLDAIVSRLRRKIHAQYPFSQPIKAVHSIGYVFTEAVKYI